MFPDDSSERGNESTGELIARAGPRRKMPPERLEEIRSAARASWRASLAGRREHAGAAGERGGEGEERGGRRTRLWRWMLAASFLVAAALAVWWNAQRGAGWPIRGDADAAAGVVELAVDARVASRAAGSRLAAGDRVAPGERIEVAETGGMLALRIGGGSLRIAAGSAVDVLSAHEVELRRGALYFDSGATNARPSPRGTSVAEPSRAQSGPGQAFRVRTPWGVVEEVGTQFEVRIPADAGGEALRVRVREGEVRLRAPGVDQVAARGTELVVRPSGVIEREAIAVAGDEWSWVLEAAPPFEREGRTLGAYLDWVARETGWTIRFAETGLAELRTEVMRGPPVRHPARFRETLLANDLSGEVVDGELVVRALRSP